MVEEKGIITMSDKNNVCHVQYGGGMCSTLFIVFLVLKLVNVIDWSWWWVTAPLWIPLGLAVGLGILVAVVALLVSCFKRN